VNCYAKLDKAAYKQRNSAGRLFNKLKQFGRVAIQYRKGAIITKPCSFWPLSSFDCDLKTDLEIAHHHSTHNGSFP
jgi:hypothetical protein